MTNSYRQSNIELLRIIAMLMVLLLHANYQALGMPNPVIVQRQPIFSLARIFSENCCIVAVNVFVLISGWFGINISFRKFFSFFFQCVFLSFLITCVFQSTGLVDLNIKGIIYGIGLSWLETWFMPCYWGLMLLSPIVNAFFLRNNRKNIRYFLFLFSLYEFLSWIFPGYSWGISNGYSVVHLLYIYSIGRFLRDMLDTTLTQRRCILTYVLIVLINTGLSLVSIYKPIRLDVLAYSSPLVVLESIALFLFFTKSLKGFSSTIINKIAQSSFAILIIHHNGFIYPYFLSTVRNISMIQHPVLIRIGFMVLFVMIVYVVCTLIDFLQQWISKYVGRWVCSTKVALAIDRQLSKINNY